jgi:hypothetical protein
MLDAYDWAGSRLGFRLSSLVCDQKQLGMISMCIPRRDDYVYVYKYNCSDMITSRSFLSCSQDMVICFWLFFIFFLKSEFISHAYN